MDTSETETDWSQERKKLIQKVIASKTEHQQCLLNLKKKSQEYDLVASEKAKGEKLCEDLSSQLRSLQIEIENLKTQNAKKESENLTRVDENQMQLKEKSQECELLKSEKSEIEKLCADRVNKLSSQLHALQIETSNIKSEYSKKESENITLVHENKTLNARIKQLQAIQPQTTSADDAIQLEPKNQADTYEMEKIVDHEKKKNGLHFCVRWKGFSAKDDTWEHESRLMCALCKYKKKNKFELKFCIIFEINGIEMFH